MIYDLIIVGGGPAALTAGIYGARKELKILVLADKPSWQISSAPVVENYPGFKSISGPEIFKKIKEHFDSYGMEIREEKVGKVELSKDSIFQIKTASSKYSAKTIIVATGRFPKNLDVPGEKEFTGKGVSYCVTCDGPLFSGKDIAVIGGGNAGLETALELTNYAKKIYLITGRLIGDEILQKKLENFNKVEYILNARAKEIKGEKFVKSLTYHDKKTGEIKEVKVDGVFVEIGSIPSTDFVKDLVELNEFGEIIINPKTNMTKTPGLFAAGDVTDVKYKQIIIACSEGAKAALSAYNYRLGI